MTDPLIVDQADFEELCQHIAAAGIVAFDTEFVSEHTYRPVLCLLQFATRDRCVAVDPLQVRDLGSWWALMADAQTTVVAHAAREEVRFCRTLTGNRPQRLVDVQIAEGIRSRAFPLSHGALVARVLGERVQGTETRTDWRQRPLSKRQLKYALDDVRHLMSIWSRQLTTLREQNRVEWAEAEFERMVDEVSEGQSAGSWQRLSGIHKLAPRELVVARELCRWRERMADERNRPLRTILRDDLIVDLARRQPATAQDVLATRDMNRTSYKQSVRDILECIVVASEIPESEWPQRPAPRSQNHDEHVLTKLLSIALANRCAELDISTTLVGTSADLRDLVRWHVESDHCESPPRLKRDWRAEVCGSLLTDLLDGRISLRVADPDSDHPLVFERSKSDD